MIFNMCQCSPVPIQISVYHLCRCLLVEVLQTTCLNVANTLQGFTALICWNMHVSPPPPLPQVRTMLCPTLICFGWRQLHTPRQNEGCHGNLLHGNPNSLAASQTVAMAQLSIYVCWDFVGSPPFQSFQSKAWCKTLSLMVLERRGVSDDYGCLVRKKKMGWPIIFANKAGMASYFEMWLHLQK